MGPLLFAIAINDIDVGLDCGILIYADDVKLYLPISSLSDCYKLHKNLCRIVQWSKDNNLELNPKKCTVMSYCTGDYFNYCYAIEDELLHRSFIVRDLGVIFDRRLTFKPHVIEIINSANKSLGYLLRMGRNFTDYRTLRTLFCVYVRPKLEYVSLLWSPNFNIQIDDIEKCQRRIFKYLEFKRTGSYPPRGVDQKYLLQKFDLELLRDRRDFQKIIFVIKLVRNYIDAPMLLPHLPINVPRYVTRELNTFYIPATNDKYYINSVMYKCIKLLNEFASMRVSEVDIFNDDFMYLCTA